MKAMLFAAGRGTRLQPLTNNTPKCLVKAGDRTLLEHNIQYLKNAGVDTVVVNVHHLADQVIAYVESQSFGVEIHTSHERDLLETGGGLLKARHHFEDEDDFVVCNSDIYTDFDLRVLLGTHRAENNLATLVVAQRETSRYLRFDDHSLLCGWENRISGESISWSSVHYTTKAFNGLQVMSPGIFDYMDGREQAFSTIPVYLDAAEQGERIQAFPMGDAFWMDIGTPEKLDALNEHLYHNK
ncbi:MAG: nucleotidyltransferase family protein [Candidatus Marinimicrobia bacterium]|nr:nucleotidyltransferase family protein [Candidatus Neomarinimicrobiota bacterium]MCF7904516.1 nucleotidyltransferase family protein [Candidatus Neomarinimicrobiota bacterium]